MNAFSLSYDQFNDASKLGQALSLPSYVCTKMIEIPKTRRTADSSIANSSFIGNGAQGKRCPRVLNDLRLTAR